MKVLTVSRSSLTAFLPPKQHIHNIWTETDLSNPHYVASYVSAIAFSSQCKWVSVFITL